MRSAYADDLAIMRADGNWQSVEVALSQRHGILVAYLHTWKLKLSTTKYELAVHLDDEPLPICSNLNTLEQLCTYF